jgi:oligopeptide transport system substrate-binding protein
MLEPQQTESGTVDVTFLNYEGLARFDEEMNVVPGAAESWEFNADGTSITFRLHENLTYSDGSPLTAERFRYALTRICDPNLGSWNAEGLFDIVGCEELNTSLDGEGEPGPEALAVYEAAKARLGVRAVDERTLEIDLRQPAPYFPALAANHVGFMPIKEELVEGRGPEMWLDPATWVGNGPFQVAAIEQEDSRPWITFVRNERYWGGKAKLDGIEFLVMSYDEAQEAYRRGDVDVMRPWDESLPAIEADPVLSREVLQVASPFVGLFNFNLTKEPFTDQKVREAFAYAFDRDDYCREISYGACTPHLSWIPPGVPGHIETDAYAFNPQKARQALAASSYGAPDELPEIVFYHPHDDEWDIRQAEWLADQFRQVLDVELTLAPVSYDEFDAMLDDVATRPQLVGTYWYSDLPDPYQWMRMWTCGSAFFTVKIGYCNPEYDALVDRADREMDPEERIRLAEESERLLLAGAPAIFGYSFGTTFLVKPYVTGYSPTAPYQYWPGWWAPLALDVERPE